MKIRMMIVAFVVMAMMLGGAPAYAQFSNNPSLNAYKAAGKSYNNQSRYRDYDRGSRYGFGGIGGFGGTYDARSNQTAISLPTPIGRVNAVFNRASEKAQPPKYDPRNDAYQRDADNRVRQAEAAQRAAELGRLEDRIMAERAIANAEKRALEDEVARLRAQKSGGQQVAERTRVYVPEAPRRQIDERDTLQKRRVEVRENVDTLQKRRTTTTTVRPQVTKPQPKPRAKPAPMPTPTPEPVPDEPLVPTPNAPDDDDTVPVREVPTK